GGKIAYIETRSTVASIALISPDGSNYTAIPINIGASIANPSLSPNGTKIVFQANTGMNANSSIWVVNMDGSGLQELTPASQENNGPNYNPSWAPDGTMIAFVSERNQIGHGQVYTMDSSGANI